MIYPAKLRQKENLRLCIISRLLDQDTPI